MNLNIKKLHPNAKLPTYGADGAAAFAPIGLQEGRNFLYMIQTREPRFIRGYLPMQLPEHHHPHDAQWLKEQLGRLPVHLQRKAIAGYDAAYQEAHNAEPVEHRKDGRARFAANSRLREYINKIMLARFG